MTPAPTLASNLAPGTPAQGHALVTAANPYAAQAGMEDLARLSGRSLAAFKRDVQEIFGMPPGRWIRQRRLERARLMLAKGDLQVSEVAFQCGFENLSHFSRAFKQTVGCPPHQWLLQQRVERAKELILNTDEPLCAIALDTGFADQSHFTRVFSQHVKASPAAWRRDQAR